MKRFLIIGILLILIPLSSYGDTIVLKTGERIDTQGTWEENGAIRYFKDGNIAPGIPKSSVVRIIPEQGDKMSRKVPESGNNLAKRLEKSERPRNPIERMVNATVTIRSAAGSGSGFFITRSGHIITNRHVIKGDDKKLKSYEKKLRRAEKRLKEFGRWIETEKNRIKKMEQQIKTDQRYDTPHNLTVLANEKKQYHTRLSEYKEQSKRLSEKSSQHRRLKTKLLLQNKIRVILADQTEHYAFIESVSTDRDLALLKLPDTKTPAIVPGNVRKVAKGETLYAIGNPLDFSHSVSAGVLSGHQRGMIMTSAPINAGNSGGPLVTKEGKVVGINTMKLVGKGVEGIGFAIPIQAAIREFEDILRPHLTVQPAEKPQN